MSSQLTLRTLARLARRIAYRFDPQPSLVRCHLRSRLKLVLLAFCCAVDPFAPDESRRLIGRALEGNPEILALPDGMILAVQPILGEGDAILGALYLRTFSGVLRPNSFLASTFAAPGK